MGPFIANFADITGVPFGKKVQPVATGVAPQLEGKIDISGTKRKRGHGTLISAKLEIVKTPPIKPRSYKELKKAMLQEELECLEKRSEVNNSRLVDNEDNQKIESSTVELWKSQGVNSKEIIKELVSNSETFDSKTSPSKAKYIRSKTERHSFEIRILRATSLTIGEVLWTRTKIEGTLLNGLRPDDSLPYLLYKANICANSRVLVSESINGYLIGSILERIGGLGKVFSTFIGPTVPKLTNLGFFNFEEKIRDCINFVDLTKLLTNKVGDEHLAVIEEARRRREQTQTSETERLKFLKWQEKKKNDIKFFQKQKRAFSELREIGADSLIIAHKANPQDVFLKHVPFLKFGGSFAIFSAYVEILTRLKELLQKENLAVNVKVEELFTRKIQVAPEKTHPFMRMRGASGFILSGIKVKST